MRAGTQSSEEGAGSLGAGVTGICELMWMQEIERGSFARVACALATEYLQPQTLRFYIL